MAKFKATLFTVAKGGSTPCTHEWTNRILSNNGMLLSLKKEGDPDTHTTWRDLEDIMLSDLSLTQKDKLLYDSTCMRFLEESDS